MRLSDADDDVDDMEAGAVGGSDDGVKELCGER